MTMSGIKHILLISSFAILSSCAYMQTSKNVQESSRTYTGYQMTTELSLHQAGNQYYIGTNEYQLRKHYPVIYDTAFLKQHNEPWFETTGEPSKKAYCLISSSTAEVLLRKDGYVELASLKSELIENQDSWTIDLPANARTCEIKAKVSGDTETWPSSIAPAGAPAKLLGALDFVCVDVPGTVLYNAAIPLMAPFVFFYEFLTEE